MLLRVRFPHTNWICLIEEVLIFLTCKHAFIIADNFHSYNILLIILD